MLFQICHKKGHRHRKHTGVVKLELQPVKNLAYVKMTLEYCLTGNQIHKDHVVDNVYMINACSFLLVSLNTNMSSSNSIFLIHHSVQLFSLPLSNSPADAELGLHSKTAGVLVSELINTQNYFPPSNHILFFSNMHKEKTEMQFSLIALLNIY